MPGIAEIIKNASGRYSLHTHTQFCDGRDTMAEIAAKADAEGFSVLGFSPHAPINVETTCNMSADDVTEYKYCVETIRKNFPRMTVLAGMEVDFIDEEHGPDSASVVAANLDYVIGSVHFIPDKQGVFRDVDGCPERFRSYVDKYFDGDLDYVIKAFWSQTQRMIGKGGFDIIGHIDKIARNASTVRPDIEQEPEYRRMADETIDLAIDWGTAIEINTKQRDTSGRFFPHPRFWARIARSGVAMPINSDAHWADKINSGRDDARNLLKAIVALKSCPDVTLSVVSADGELHTFDQRGVADLHTLLNECPGLLRGATVADRVVGRGAAALMCAGGVSQVYTDVISRAALETFAFGKDIKVDYDLITEYIINRKGDGPCPVEALTADTPRPADCLPIITEFLNKVSSRSK